MRLHHERRRPYDLAAVTHLWFLLSARDRLNKTKGGSRIGCNRRETTNNPFDSWNFSKPDLRSPHGGAHVAWIEELLK